MKIFATTAKAALLFMLATSWVWLFLPQEATGEDLSGPATINCGKRLGGVRHLTPCQVSLEETQWDIRFKADILKRLGLEVAIIPKKWFTASDKTLRIMFWLHDLCTDWNACAITPEKYQERKDRLLSLEESLNALVAQAPAVKDEARAKGTKDSQAVKDFEKRLDEYIAAIDQFESEFRRR